MLAAAMKALRCPSCDLPMPAILVGAVEVDFCEEDGLWLDGGELEMIAAEAGDSRIVVEQLGPPPRRPTKSHPFCPRCDRPLAPAAARGVALDVCPRGHGVWVEHGELDQVLSALGRKESQP